jgi:hypothetical protein
MLVHIHSDQYLNPGCGLLPIDRVHRPQQALSAHRRDHNRQIVSHHATPHPESLPYKSDGQAGAIKATGASLDFLYITHPGHGMANIR